MNKKEERRIYEPPVSIPLGELAKGAGSCWKGNADVSSCTAGPSATKCSAGSQG